MRDVVKRNQIGPWNIAVTTPNPIYFEALRKLITQNIENTICWDWRDKTTLHDKNFAVLIVTAPHNVDGINDTTRIVTQRETSALNCPILWLGPVFPSGLGPTQTPQTHSETMRPIIHWTKTPVHPQICLFDINRLLRAENFKLVSLGDVRYSYNEQALLTENGTLTSLTQKEAAILEYMIKRADETIHGVELLRDVWGYAADMSTRTLITHIYTLRQKLEKNSAFPKVLISDGGGYRLIVG